MAASDATAVTEEVQVRPVLDGAGWTDLRARVRTEIARRNPRPVALRTLELLALAALEPAADPSGYRVIDRHGNLRRQPSETGEGAPLTLSDLADDLVARHPALFVPPPEPEAPAEDAAKDSAKDPLKDSALAAGASEVRAATARFVEAQSERARALAERSSEQGRALAHSAATAFAGLRHRIDGARAEGTGREPPRWRARLAETRAVLAERLDRTGSAARRWREAGPAQDRRWIAAAAGGALATIAAAGLVAAYRSGGGERPVRAEAPPASQAPREAANGGGQTPPPETEGGAGRGGDEGFEPPRVSPNAVTGTAQVIDTATLRINGKLMRLFGVEWVRGGQAEELARYINSRPVTCQPVPGSENQFCQIEGRDLSEVVLFNGGGRASPEATPELVAAEDHARSERLGVWKR